MSVNGNGGDAAPTRGARRRQRLSLVDPASPLPAAGECLGGRYLIIEPLGSGGHGAVYRAKDLLLGRDIALKLLDGIDGAPRERSEALVREAQALARIKHRAIVAIHDAGAIDGRDVLCMELVPGRSLADALDDGPVPLDRAMRWMEALADAVDTAHAHGVIHGDVKPANIIIDVSGQPKLVDFGIARMNRTSNPQDSDTSGTPGYAPPELWAGQVPGVRGDLYSLAATCFAMLTGRAPFVGNSLRDIIDRTLHAEPPLANVVNPKLPRGLARVLQSGLARAPEDRPASARDLVRSLRRAIHVRRAIRIGLPLMALLPLVAWGLREASLARAPAVVLDARLQGERWNPETLAIEPVDVGENTVLREGDAIWLNDATVSRRAHVDVYLLDPAGTFQKIGSAEGPAGELELLPGRAYRIPADAALSWRLDDAIGTETLLVAGRRGTAPDGIEARVSAALGRIAAPVADELKRGASPAASRSRHAALEAAAKAELETAYEAVVAFRFAHAARR